MTNNKKWFTLAAACLALFMAILDNLVVNVALPTISRDLQASTTQLQWIVSAYTLVFASIQITAGGLGDRLGRKRWFLGGLALFTSASLFGAFAQNVGMLIAARALQGLGAAFIMPLTLSLISVAFPPAERGRAIGIWSAISVSGLAFGPIIGGALVQYASWHWVFLINVPIGIFTFIFAAANVRESRDESGDVAFDLPGTVLITGAVASLTWALIEAGDRGWGDALILAAFAAAVVLLGAFIAVEAHVARPMVPLGFFRSSTFTGANIDAFAISFAIGGVAFFLTLYQQNVHGFSPVRSGLSLLPLVLMMMAGAPLSGVLVARVGTRLLISIGMIISGIGTLFFLRAAPGARYVDLLPAFLVLGAGNSLIFAPMTTAVLNSVESHRSGVASAVNGAVREIGTAFSIALLGTLANRVYRTDFSAAPDIVAARANPAYAPPVQGVIDFIGSGSSFGGRVIEDANRFPGLPAPLVGQLRDVSSIAFVNGMHSAIVVSSIGMFIVSVVSFLLIRDSATITRPVPATEPLPEENPMPTDPKPVFAPATYIPASNGHNPDAANPYAEPVYVLSGATGNTADGYRPYGEAAEAGNGYVLDGYATNGYAATNGHDGNGYDVNGAMRNGSSYEGDYYAPYTVAPLPVPQWGPAYADAPYAVPPTATPFADMNANGYPTFSPTYGSAPAAYPAYPAPAWSPAREYAPMPPAYPNNTWYDAPPVAPLPSSQQQAPSFMPPTYPPGAAWMPEHLTPPIPAPAPASVQSNPAFGYEQPYRTEAYPVFASAAVTPPGDAWVPDSAPPATAATMRDDGRDDAFEARIAALEQFTREIVPHDHAGEHEVDMLTRKVAALEDILMRFMSEIPIRLGGEIGVLERRVAYLSDELPARLHAESDSANETAERLDRKLVALERFAQTMPSARWHHDHDARSEVLERRVMELERFCAALARRGTAPREIAATTTTGISTPANSKANGHTAAPIPTPVTATRNDPASEPESVSTASAVESREGERRRGRR